MRHLIVGASHLEAEHGLQVLALQEDLVAQFAAQVHRGGDGRFLEDIVDSRGEDEAEVLYAHNRWLVLPWSQNIEHSHLASHPEYSARPRRAPVVGPGLWSCSLSKPFLVVIPFLVSKQLRI